MKKIDLRFFGIVLSLITVLLLSYDFKKKLDSLNHNYQHLLSIVYDLNIGFKEHLIIVKKSVINLQFNNDIFVRHAENSRNFQKSFLNLNENIKKEYPTLFKEFELYIKEKKNLKTDTFEFIKLNSSIKNSLTILDMNLQKNLFSYDKEYIKKLIQIINEFKRLKNDFETDEKISPMLVDYFKNYKDSSPVYKFNYIHIKLIYESIERFNYLFKNIENSKVLYRIKIMKKGLENDTAKLKNNISRQFYIIVAISFLFSIVIIVLVNNLKKDAANILKLKEKSEKALKTDKLTGLNNKIAFNHDIKKSKNTSIVLLDITDFRSINAIGGYKGGDNILQQFSAFLSDHIKGFKSYNLYRVGIDQFALVIKEKNEIELNIIVSGLIKKIESTTFKYKDLDLQLYIQAGIAVNSNSLRNAEIAINKTKNSFQKISFYNKEMKEDKQNIKSNIEMLKKLETAMKENKVRPFFQPIVDLQTKETVKYEALVRLIDEDSRAISPYFFLELSKKSKHYSKITQLVIKKSFEFIKETNNCVSINLSYMDINDPSTLDFIKHYLKENPQIAKNITFELLESDDIDDYGNLLKFSQMIKSFGCLLAIDDFGSGYSNFTHLFNTKPDIVKIDGSLIKDIDKDETSKNIVKALIRLCKESNIKTVAEFVDNDNVDRIITQMGVDFGQGYFYSPPKDLLKSS